MFENNSAHFSGHQNLRDNVSSAFINRNTADVAESSESLQQNPDLGGFVTIFAGPQLCEYSTDFYV